MPIQVSSTDPAERAKGAAQLRYGGQEDAIKRAIEALAVTRAADEAAINTYGKAGRGAINTTFDELASNLGINREQTKKDLGTQANLIGQGYRDAASIGEAAREQAIASLQGLGGSGMFSREAVAQAASPLEALAARIVAQNAMSDATTTGNLQNWAAQQDALLGAGMAGAERDRGDRLGGFETELLRAISEAKNQASKAEYDYNAKLLDMLQERGVFTADAANNFADTIFGQQLQAAQFNLAEQEAAAQAAARGASNSLAAEELAFKRELANREAAKPDTAEYWKQLDYDLRKKAMQQGSTEWLADQKQREFANKMGIAELFAQGGADPAAINQYLIEQGILPAPRPVQTPSSVAATAAKKGISATAAQAYGSRPKTQATTTKPLYGVGNMRTWLGM